MEEDDGRLNDGNECSSYRSLKAYEEEYSGPSSEQMQNDMHRMRCFPEVADAALKENDSY